jgi:hypothetical protein
MSSPDPTVRFDLHGGIERKFFTGTQRVQSKSHRGGDAFSARDNRQAVMAENCGMATCYARPRRHGRAPGKPYAIWDRCRRDVIGGVSRKVCVHVGIVQCMAADTGAPQRFISNPQY